jgi:hypothetical protein
MTRTKKLWLCIGLIVAAKVVWDLATLLDDLTFDLGEQP